MNETSPLGLVDLLCLLLVVGVAAGVRLAYVVHYAEDGQAAPAFVVQGGQGSALPGVPEPAHADFRELVNNLRTHRWFGCTAPLSHSEEETAHVAPGYPWLVSLAGRVQEHPAALIRWIQCGLGSLTVLCYFFFARRAFGSTLAATIAGVLTALYPFWIINTAEVADGVLATFLLAVVLVLGTRGSQEGGAFTSALFGLSLAGLALVRATLLPFAVVAFVWYLARCRAVRQGWFAALLALLGFANGLAPWTVRNWQTFHEPIPIVDSAYLHLWMGNNPLATGAALDEATLERSLRPELLERLLQERGQPHRYAQLGPEVLAQVADHPAATLGHRLEAALCFLLGGDWLQQRHLVVSVGTDEARTLNREAAEVVEAIARGSLLVVLLLGALGWRWSAGWAWHGRLAAIAIVWVPLPYLLTHAEALSGPRLPLDGVLLCYVAFVLCCCVPPFLQRPDPAAADQAAIQAAG